MAATPFAPDVAQNFVKAPRLKGGAKWIRDGVAYRDSGGGRVRLTHRNVADSLLPGNNSRETRLPG
jgi:hypothetical protein